MRVHCAQCHAIDKVSESPLPIAPPFRNLHLKYPIESLQRPLSEGIIVGHPTMPQFRLEPDQVTDVIAYFDDARALSATAAENWHVTTPVHRW